MINKTMAPMLRESLDLLGFVLPQLPRPLADALCERLFARLASPTFDFSDRVVAPGAKQVVGPVVMCIGGVDELIMGTLLAAEPLRKEPSAEERCVRSAHSHGGVIEVGLPVCFVLKPLVLKLMGPTTTRLEVFPSRDGTTPFGHPLLTVQVPRELKPSDLPFLRDRLFAIAAKFSPTADRPPE